MLLAGIVAIQVEVLKAGASMGRALAQTTALTSPERAAPGNRRPAWPTINGSNGSPTSMGLVIPPPGAVGYIRAGRAATRAVRSRNIHTPDAAAFVR